MPSSREYDVKWLDDLALPFDQTTKELSDAKPRLIEGQNMYITLGGKLAIRPGFAATSLVGANALNGRPDRLIIYETLENPPKIWLVTSMFVTPYWAVYVVQMDGAAPNNAWAPINNYNNVNESTRPHEISVVNGLCYIKAFPTSGSNKYGAVIFNGTGATSATAPLTQLWGLPSPTLSTLVTLPASGWAASINPVSVYFGWGYCYCWESSTGQYSNRSPITFTPGLSSFTGPFTNKKPVIQVQGHVDTINIPYIRIFRTTDGGGTFYYLDRIANTGATYINYTDNRRLASTTDDPQTDTQLDTFNVAPSEVSNTVPPPVDAFHVIGTDPVQASSPIGYYARRHWYAIGNRLYYSGNEEITNGIPEESFVSPNGIRGNYFIMRSEVRLIKDTNAFLYIITSKEVGGMRGADRLSFIPYIIVKDVGAAYGHPRAIAAFRDGVFFLSSDFQIYALAGNNEPVIISTPISEVLKQALAATSCNCFMEVYSSDGNIYLFVTVINLITPSATQVFVYDLVRNLWFTPWTIPMSAMAFGQYRTGNKKKELIAMTWDGTKSNLLVYTPGTFLDNNVLYTPFCTLNLFTLPSGNHINMLRKPGHFPMLSYFIVERTKFDGDFDIAIYYRLNEISGDVTSILPTAPPYSTQHVSFVSNWYPLEKVAQRATILINGTEGQNLEIQNIGFVFQSEAGT